MTRGSCGARARFVVPAVVCLLWLLPSTASAQCWYEAGLYADLYDNGVDVVEVYGAGWDGSYCPPCGHTYRLDATLWFNSALVDSQSYNAIEGTASYNTAVSGWVSYDVAFEIECACAGPINVGQVGGSQQVERWPIPTGETFYLLNWLGGGGISQWWQTLQPSNVNFAGRTVKEFQGGTGVDFCHFSGSIQDPFTELTGGDWPVEGSENLWGPDNLSWSQADIEYYRAQGRAPCFTTIPQSMRINVAGGGYVQYLNHNLKFEIGVTEVRYQRGNFDPAYKPWP